jgi:predicted permease
VVAADLWVPVRLAPRLGIGGAGVEERGNRGLFGVARLAPGVSVARAQGAMDLVAARLRAAHPEQWTDVRQEGRRVTLLEERLARVPPQVRGPALAFTALLGATVVLVLLVCCANVAGLLLARATTRGREVALRLSLGATRGRIVRQLLVEGALLAVLGAAVGLAATRWVTGALAHLDLPLPIALTLDVAPDARVLAFSAAVTALAVLAFGLVPALRASRADVHAAIKAGAVAAGRTRLQSALVVGQLATSLVLAASALLFVRAVRAAGATDPGFSARAMLLVPLERVPGGAGDSSAATVGRLVRERLAGTPGVLAVSWADIGPLDAEVSRRGTLVEGYARQPGEDLEFAFNVVGPGYFETLGLPLARGRGFGDGDRAGAPGVIVVNEAFARRFWGDRDPLGRRVSLDGGATWREVVGVAGDAKYKSLAEGPREYVYTPALQEDGRGVTLHVRTAGDPRAVRAAVRAAVREAAPGWVPSAERTLTEQVDASLLPQRAAGAVLGAFGVLSLLLGAVGVYGVVAFSVARRTREIGVRIALGARAADVVRLVVRQSAALAVGGLLVGVPLAWGASRLLRGLLLGMAGGVALPLLGAALVLGLAAATASWVPARRAANVDAVRALRAD